jgi:hypothetical protein
VDRELLNHWEEVESALLPLRGLLAENEGARRAFDEYLDHNEFELALDVLCDTLLALPDCAMNESDLQAIEGLGRKMRLEDPRVAQLREPRV